MLKQASMQCVNNILKYTSQTQVKYSQLYPLQHNKNLTIQDMHSTFIYCSLGGTQM
jgi:hypothetical protein